MHQYVFGQKQIDIKNAKRALENHKVDINSPLRTEYSKWETLLSNLEYAQSRFVTDIEKISWQCDQFNTDPQLQIQAPFVTSAAKNEPYMSIIDTLIRAYDNMAAEDPLLHSASINTTNMISSSHSSQNILSCSLACLLMNRR